MSSGNNNGAISHRINVREPLIPMYTTETPPITTNNNQIRETVETEVDMTLAAERALYAEQQ